MIILQNMIISKKMVNNLANGHNDKEHIIACLFMNGFVL